MTGVMGRWGPTFGGGCLLLLFITSKVSILHSLIILVLSLYISWAGEKRNEAVYSCSFT